MEMSDSIFEQILRASQPPKADRAEWLEGAANSVELLKNSLKSDEIILYASGPNFYVQAVLAQKSAIDQADSDELMNAYIDISDSWSIAKVYGGGEGHRIYLEPPLAFHHTAALAGAEKLIFVRGFMGMSDYRAPIEISQKLIHALDLHFLEERNAFCRLDSNGDIESVIRVHRRESSDPWKEVRAVTIGSRDLATYMALTETTLFTRFDFTRFIGSGFSGWGDGASSSFKTPGLVYHHKSMPGYASFANGYILLRTAISVEQLVEEWKEESDPSTRRYASFKIVDWKNRREVETPCDPEHIVNYFTDSDLPWEISPAFFKPEVLYKYKADSEKYTLQDRSITCRGSWHLKTYDINEAGQVHTYIGYLADLPYEEQLYWQSFNEWPKASISERAHHTDILGEFAPTTDYLEQLREKVRLLDDGEHIWWTTRGDQLRANVHYPAADSVDEWANEILTLQQLVVEGFRKKGLAQIGRGNSATLNKQWGSLKTLEACLAVMGRTEDQAKALVAPMYELNDLRMSVKGHSDPNGRRAAVTNARKLHGTLREHFRDLVRRVGSALEQIHSVLSDNSA